MKKTSISILTSLLLIVFAATASFASTIGVTGDGNIIVPNATPNTGMTANFFQDTGENVLIHAWDELQGFVLTSSILLDFTTTGLHTGSDFTENFSLVAGTKISSSYVYFDPLNGGNREATFEYSSDIIGVIVFSDLMTDRLLATDFLKNPFTVAPSGHYDYRGFEAPDMVTISADRRHLTFNLTASSPGNQARVITKATTQVAEPASLVLLGFGLLGLVAVRRRVANNTTQA
jgi:PEP-CTERM motif